jgi:hypothetical protein
LITVLIDVYTQMTCSFISQKTLSQMTKKDLHCNVNAIVVKWTSNEDFLSKSG